MRGLIPGLLVGLLITWTGQPRSTEAVQVDPPRVETTPGPDFVRC